MALGGPLGCDGLRVAFLKAPKRPKEQKPAPKNGNGKNAQDSYRHPEPYHDSHRRFGGVQSRSMSSTSRTTSGRLKLSRRHDTAGA
jgi:hypothetical protein